MEAMNTMIHDQDLPMHLWAKAARTFLYVQNRLSHSALGFKTPKEMYTRKKPEVSHLNIFGCLVYVHIPKENRIKLDPSRKKGIFVGYCEVSKSFMIYISGFHHIDICTDSTFDEDTTLKKYGRCHIEEVHKENVPPRMIEVEPSPEIVAYEDHDMIEPQEPPTMDIYRKIKPTWVRAIIQEGEKYGSPEGSTRKSKRSKSFSNYVALMCDIVDQEPTSDEESIQNKEWVEAMTEEYQSIMNNDV